MRIFIKFSFATVISLCMVFAICSAVYGEPVFPEGSMVRQTCGACHKPDPDKRLEVIEETRKTPEEWKVVVDRMIRINSAPLEDENFNAVIKEVSKNLCLTPGEMSQVAYLNSDENSQYREIPKNDLEKRIYTACVRCHTYGKIVSHKMTSAQWAENRNLHLGYYPTVIPQMREMDWYKESQELVEPLAKLFAFDTPEWQEWIKNRNDQDISGEWKVFGYQPGLGYYSGTYTFEANSKKGEDEYLVEKNVTYQSGTTLKMKGEGTLYSEYHLRYALAPTPLTGRIEGVFDLNAEEMGFNGKWWTVVQDSNAYGNEKFYKTGGSPRVFAAYPHALKAGAEQTLTLLGVNLPETVSEADIKFSDANVKVVKAEKSDDSKIVCKLDVGANVPVGVLTLNVKDLPYGEGVKIFDKIDSVKIFPAIGRARVSSGAAYPPQGVQFVAYGMHFGKDGKADTDDDLMLEPLDAKWWLEEEKTRENDDDMKYLDIPVANGLYTPVTTYAPIEERQLRREGVGLIAIGASYTDGDRELKGRSLLAVTVPDFITHLK
ncbi:quinohemoprotein amine dehydrogenase subunit alpha [Desulfococcaceae bacterium HSG8]|nr:quinohemoprotein amine dehydrogenase subunit alpha [Desulfococcaceae bacterium HSG8]